MAQYRLGQEQHFFYLACRLYNPSHNLNQCWHTVIRTPMNLRTSENKQKSKYAEQCFYWYDPISNDFEVCHKLPKMTCEEATKELVYSLKRNRNKESNMSWHGKICGDICKWKTETLFFNQTLAFTYITTLEPVIYVNQLHILQDYSAYLFTIHRM